MLEYILGGLLGFTILNNLTSKKTVPKKNRKKTKLKIKKKK